MPTQADPKSKEFTPEVEPWGELNGKAVHVFTLTNESGMVAKLSDYGATLLELHVPDKDGKLADVTRGFDDLEGYRSQHNPYFGATVGRVANRIKNASFTLEGKTYQLAANAEPHSLHGGKVGWDKRLWQGSQLESQNAVRFTLTSEDGDEGYPGTVNATVVYTLTNDDELRIEMTAVADPATPLNMVHHSYWNLGGDGSESIRDHLLRIQADKYTPGGPELVPTGEEVSVAGTPFDFRETKPIGQDLMAAGGDPIGYDYNFIINGPAGELRSFAVLEDPDSGRVMELSSDQAGLQLYTGNFMDGSSSGRGQVHAQYSALCLESQMFPDAINQDAWRERVILKPGETYRHVMLHRFSTQ